MMMKSIISCSPRCLTVCLLPMLSPGAVFTGYYNSNPPGVYFSMPVLLSLLWALLKAGMVSDVFSVLGVSLAHKIVVSVVHRHPSFLNNVMLQYTLFPLEDGA